MALTMVHLMVADLWAAEHPVYRNCPEFYLGAVSPDAIHIRDHDDKSHKDEIHLYNWQSLHREPIEAYWHQWHAPFDIGYGLHVLTDCQWVPRYKERLKGLFLPNGKLDISTYYNDTFVTDFQLYREHLRLEEILQLVEHAHVPENHPLLTCYEINEWRKVILNAYRGECPKNDPVRFITKAYVEEFATDCLAMMDEIYGQVFCDIVRNNESTATGF